MKYDLKALAKGKRGRVELPRIDARLSTEREYERALNAMLAGVARHVKERIIPSYQGVKLTADDSMLRDLIAGLTSVASRMVERVLRLERVRHTETFIKTVKRTIGIDLSAVVRDEDLDNYMRLAVERNVSLITGIGDELAKRIEQTVYRNGIAGNSVKSLQADLQRDFRFAKSRAQLIARDQTAKFNSDLTRIRQEQAGVTTYKWSTSLDERVRPLHRALDGKEYAWGERTGAEDGLPPGQPIRCRCVAIGVVDFGGSNEPRKRNQSPDEAAQSYVVERGKKDGKEHLVAVDTATGQVLEQRSDGKKGSVGVSPFLVAALRDKRRSIVVHHNHPSGGSFSQQDIAMLGELKGMKGLYAHGNNGASYYAERGRLPVDRAIYSLYDKQLRPVIQELVNRKPELIPDINAIYFHLLMEALDSAGYVQYRAKLTAEQRESYERVKDAMVN